LMIISAPKGTGTNVIAFSHNLQTYHQKTPKYLVRGRARQRVHETK